MCLLVLLESVPFGFERRRRRRRRQVFGCGSLILLTSCARLHSAQQSRQSEQIVRKTCLHSSCLLDLVVCLISREREREREILRKKFPASRKILSASEPDSRACSYIPAAGRRRKARASERVSAEAESPRWARQRNGSSGGA